MKCKDTTWWCQEGEDEGMENSQDGVRIVKENIEQNIESVLKHEVKRNSRNILENYSVSQLF